MVIATFLSSYLAAYKLWKYTFGKNYTALTNITLPQSLKNSQMNTSWKASQLERNNVTTAKENDDNIPVEFEPVTATGQQHRNSSSSISCFETQSCKIAVDLETVHVVAPESSVPLEHVTAITDNIPFEKETVSGCAHEFALESQSVNASVPEFAIEIESVSAVTEIPFEEEIVTGCVHEFALNTETISKNVPPFAVEMGTISAIKEIKEIPTEEDAAAAIANECNLQQKSATLVTIDSDSAVKIENFSEVNEISFEKEAISVIVDEVPEEVTTLRTFNEEVAVKVEVTSAKTYPPVLNAEAKEFVPQKIRVSESSCFGDASGGTSAVADTEETAGTAQEMKRPVALNPFAKEFVPTKQVCKEDESLSAGKAEAAPVTNSNESDISETTLSCNVFAREFVPSNMQNYETFQSSGPWPIPQRYDAPSTSPVQRPAPVPRPVPGFRPRGQAGIQHRPSARRFPFHRSRGNSRRGLIY